ncbi:hypothetical protein H8S90_02880 [Olivibacter sp. SDN3]|uniref:hypothetical protein n=1 Tax=Olivibacter sp. SDN3 TaxID=2764720 RepID=UPI001650ECEB|nr:hypothetical protein [Olivibacter sp. SDN3]QNL50568.1 hypothetical protein H8S90_02880 [Olivibacter sp. SDN3]
MKTSILLFTVFIFYFPLYGAVDDKELIRPFVASIQAGEIGGVKPNINYRKINDGMIKVSISFTLADTVFQDDWQVNLTPAFTPDFHWAPHLAPTSEHVIAQHVFRAPALIMVGEGKQVSIIPDLDILNENSAVDWYMDLDAIGNRLTLGMSHTEVKEHVLYHRKPGGVYPEGELRFGFYILMESGIQKPINPWRKVNAFLWEKWGQPLYASNEPLQTKELQPYVQHTYNWAFNNWKEQVWQEFELKGKVVGAPVFIVNVTQSPNYPGPVNEREFRSIWNQAWFNALRSAQGVYRYAKRTNDEQLLKYALKTKELTLAFPQQDGFFSALIATEMTMQEEDGETYNRSKGWNTAYFGNSNRNPLTGDPKQAPYHILDMSYTAWLMLTWYDELEKDERLLSYAVNYANSLITLQDAQGFFPAWLDKESLEPIDYLRQSPETAMSITFLLKLFELTNESSYQQAALKAMHVLMDTVIPEGRWEDFETYWSCSRYGAEDLVGKKVARNNLYKQNTFSMYWTAQALLACYELTQDQKYLDIGRKTLDELLMAQAIWQPPFIHVRALGGFGVMNADGEWNDSRQSLFAELILDYGKILNSKEYTQRGLAALRASFVMMYCPENPRTSEQWEKVWDFFDKQDYGFMMENYGHTGVTSVDGLGIGEFTIYDWGNGAAAEAYNRIFDHYGEAFLKED